MFARYLLADEGHRLLTESFINAVLEDSDDPLIQTIEIKSPFNLADWADDRETILDRRERSRLFTAFSNSGHI